MLRFAGKPVAVIVAHDEVLPRVLAENPANAPVVTFSDAVTFHFNGQTVAARHVDPWWK